MADDPQEPATRLDPLAIVLLVFFLALIAGVVAMLVLPALSG
jgi:hypothetical protein